MKRIILALAILALILAGCTDTQPRRIDCWQGVVDQGWVQP